MLIACLMLQISHYHTLLKDRRCSFNATLLFYCTTRKDALGKEQTFLATQMNLLIQFAFVE